MANKRGMRDGLAVDPFTGQLTYAGRGPKGFSTSSPIAEAGFYGKTVVRTSSDYGLMNKTSLTIGTTFPAPLPGSFYDGLVNHNEFAEKATEQKRAERKAQKAREKEFLTSLISSAVGRVKRLGYDPKGFLGKLLVAIQAHMILQERTHMLGFTRHQAFHLLEGVRRPSKVDQREGSEDSLRKGIHGVCHTAPRKQRFAADGLTPPYKRF